MEKDERVKVRGYSLPPEQIEWLESEAKKENRSASNLLRCIIDEAIEDSRSGAASA